MRLKTFQARNMAQALAEVRKVLGEDAIIVATVPAEDGRGVVVTAAVDGAARSSVATPASLPAAVPAAEAVLAERRAAAGRRRPGAAEMPLRSGPRAVPPVAPPPDLPPASPPARPVLRSRADDVDDEIELEFEREETASITPAAAATARREAAAAEEDPETVSKAVSPELAQIERALAFHGVGGQTGRRLLAMVRERLRAGEAPDRALAQALDRVVGFDPLGRTAGRPQALALIGLAGAGKTVTVAKLAARALTQGRRLTVVTADTIRAGGVEQLAAYTGLLGIDLLVAGSSRELARVAARARADAAGEPMTLLVDTAGVNPFFTEETEELATLIDAAELEPVLVLPAGIDPFEAADQGAAFSVLHPRRAICTRLDGARRLGAVICAAAAARVRLSEASVTAHVSEGLNPLSATGLAQLLLRDPLNLRPAKLDRDAEIRP